MNFLDYKDLDVWRSNYELTTHIYTKTDSFPKTEMFGLTQQIRRASISVISNIAEGCGRNHNRDKIQFFMIARGSLFEVECQMEISERLGFISKKERDFLSSKIQNCKKLLNGFISYHKRKS